MFTRTMPPIIDSDVLRRRAPDVAALWALLRRLQRLTVGDFTYDAFDGVSSEVRTAREALGTSLVPTLLAGRFGSVLYRSLLNYTGPPAEREPVVPELLERERCRSPTTCGR